MISALFNRCWLLTGYKDYAYFKKNMNNVSAIQSNKLMELLALNKDTDFGKYYNFHKIKNYQHYVDTVPLIENYDVQEPYIRRISNGEGNILFPGKPEFFETTSGSTSMSKLIPYNDQLKREFQKGVNVWMNDLYRSCQGIFDGPAYWSVSPNMKKSYHTQGGIQVGTSADTAYFSPLTAWFMKYMLVAPPEVKNGQTAHGFYISTWRTLLKCRDLRFISVWSPNFLLHLYAFLKEHIIEILEDASISKKRKHEVESICRGAFTFKDLFPELKLLSCWTQAQAKLWVEEVSNILGGVDIQGKGLLSTEGMISIPFQFNKHVLAYTSHFFEFRCVDNNEIYRAEEIDKHVVYEVIITTGGGLYRYCTGDWITCTGHTFNVPNIEFIGRGNAVSDLVGEKLSANVLPDILLKARQENGGPPKAMYLYAKINGNQAGYLLLIEGEGKINERVAEQLAEIINSNLMENPYYEQAIVNGQLLPLKAVIMPTGFSERLFKYYCQEYGIKDGDAKLPLLYKPGELMNLLGY